MKKIKYLVAYALTEEDLTQTFGRVFYITEEETLTEDLILGIEKDLEQKFRDHAKICASVLILNIAKLEG